MFSSEHHIRTFQMGILGKGGTVSPCFKSPPFFLLYITSRYAYMEHTLLTTHYNFSVLNFKLGMMTNYPLDWMFFFCTRATISPSCWVWKLSNVACPLNLGHSASFLMRSDWLEKKVDQWLCIRKEALGTRLMPTNTMVRCYIITNKSVLHF